MSIVKINAMQIPEGKGEEFVERFSKRPHNIEKIDGFEGFSVLRPNDERTTWLVVTRWRDETSYRSWYGERPPRDPKTVTYASAWDLWSFDVLEDAQPAAVAE